MPLFIIIVSIYLFRLYTVITDRYVVFFIIFFINYGFCSDMVIGNSSLRSCPLEAGEEAVYFKKEKKKGGFGDRII